MSSAKAVRRDLLDDLIGIALDQSQEVFETGGVVLPDGRCVELIRDAEGILRLLDSSTEETIQVTEGGGRTYVLPNLHPSVWESITLPTGRAPCGSTAALFRQIY